MGYMALHSYMHTDSRSKAAFPGIRECSSICTGGGARSTIPNVPASSAFACAYFDLFCQPHYHQGPFVSFPAAQPMELFTYFGWRIISSIIRSNTGSMYYYAQILILPHFLHTYYYEQILKYFNCGPWIQFHIQYIRIHHDSEVFSIALLWIHTTTLVETENTVWAILQYVWILYLLMCTLVRAVRISL